MSVTANTSVNDTYQGHLRTAREAVLAAASIAHDIHSADEPAGGLHEGDWLDQIAELLSELAEDESECSGCGDLVDSNEAHHPHEPGCSEEGCTCSYTTHEVCCWDCDPIAYLFCDADPCSYDDDHVVTCASSKGFGVAGTWRRLAKRARNTLRLARRQSLALLLRVTRMS